MLLLSNTKFGISLSSRLPISILADLHLFVLFYKTNKSVAKVLKTIQILITI